MMNQMSVVLEVKSVVEEIYPRVVEVEKETSEVKKDVQTLVTNEKVSAKLLTQMRTRLNATTILVNEALKVKPLRSLASSVN